MLKSMIVLSVVVSVLLTGCVGSTMTSAYSPTGAPALDMYGNPALEQKGKSGWGKYLLKASVTVTNGYKRAVNVKSGDNFWGLNIQPGSGVTVVTDFPITITVISIDDEGNTKVWVKNVYVSQYQRGHWHESWTIR